MRDQFGNELRVGDKVVFGVTHKQPTETSVAVGHITEFLARHWGTQVAIRKDSTGQINVRRCNRILWLGHAE